MMNHVNDMKKQLTTKPIKDAEPRERYEITTKPIKEEPITTKPIIIKPLKRSFTRNESGFYCL